MDFDPRHAYDSDRDDDLEYLLGPFDADRMIRLEGLDPTWVGYFTASFKSAQESHPSLLRNVKYVTTGILEEPYAAMARTDSTLLSPNVGKATSSAWRQWLQRWDFDKPWTFPTLVAYHEHGHHLLEEEEDFGDDVLSEVAAEIRRFIPHFNRFRPEEVLRELKELGGREYWVKDINELAVDAYAIHASCLYTTPLIHAIGGVFDHYFSAETVQTRGRSQNQIDYLLESSRLAAPSQPMELRLNIREADRRFAELTERSPVGRFGLLRADPTVDDGHSENYVEEIRSATSGMAVTTRDETSLEVSKVVVARDSFDDRDNYVQVWAGVDDIVTLTKALDLEPNTFHVNEIFRLLQLTDAAIEQVIRAQGDSEEDRRAVLGFDPNEVSTSELKESLSALEIEQSVALRMLERNRFSTPSRKRAIAAAAEQLRQTTEQLEAIREVWFDEWRELRDHWGTLYDQKLTQTHALGQALLDREDELTPRMQRHIALFREAFGAREAVSTTWASDHAHLLAVSSYDVWQGRCREGQVVPEPRYEVGARNLRMEQLERVGNATREVAARADPGLRLA